MGLSFLLIWEAGGTKFETWVDIFFLFFSFTLEKEQIDQRYHFIIHSNKMKGQCSNGLLLG